TSSKCTWASRAASPRSRPRPQTVSPKATHRAGGYSAKGPTGAKSRLHVQSLPAKARAGEKAQRARAAERRGVYRTVAPQPIRLQARRPDGAAWPQGRPATPEG